jgi:SAM-dependent methyltransferase
MFSLDESIKSGRPTGLASFGEWDTVYEGLSQLPPKVQKSWFAFDHFYSDYSFSEVLPLVIAPGVKHILDVGGNTGKFAIRCAKYNEEVHVTILDLPGQLEKARANIEKEGLSDRITCLPMNLLDHSQRFPKGMDVIWMSQFLDCFSKEDIAQLLRRGKEALEGSAALFIMELLWDRQKFEASTYSLHATSLYFTNIANGCSQMYHSEDLLELINNSGMLVADSIDDIGVSHSLLKCKLKR